MSNITSNKVTPAEWVVHEPRKPFEVPGWNSMQVVLDTHEQVYGAAVVHEPTSPEELEQELEEGQRMVEKALEDQWYDDIGDFEDG